MDGVYMFNLSLTISALIISVVLAIVALINTDLKQPVHRWFYLLVLLNLFSTLTEAMEGLLMGQPGAEIHRLLVVLEYLTFTIPGLQHWVFAKYLYEYFKTKTQMRKTSVYLVGAFSLITVILTTIAQFNHMYSTIDAANHYQTQPTYWISTIAPTLSIVVYTVTTLRQIRFLKKREITTLLFYSVVPMLCFVIEIVYADIWVSHFAGTIMMLLLYINLQLELKNRMQEKEAELTENRIAIMLSQIKPHFLYNALTAIDNLFYTDPEKGHEALYTFSDYLRGNMDSLSQKELIPFARELEHTSQYLHLEKLRFRDKLQIVYEIGPRDFLVPVLTLQPIVENAVRYGVTKKPGGGCVTIGTQEEEGFYRITVCDDGVGFDPKEPPILSYDDGRSHVGIANVRGRLVAMCGGTLHIHSAQGKGTRVVMEIPKKKERKGSA